MTYSRSQSETKNAARVALSHATDCLRVNITASSCSRPLILTTFASDSNSSIVLTSPRMKSRRLAGFIPRKWVLRTTARIVSSADGGGISEASEGGSPARSGIGVTPTGRALTRGEGMRSGKGSPVESKSATFPQVNPLLPQTEKAGLNPDPSLLSVSGCAASQAGGNLFRLPEGLGAATPGGLRKRIKSPIHNPSAFEIHGYDLGHSSILKSAPRLGASST